jgi:hypothetical protein
MTLATLGSPAFLGFRIRDFPPLPYGRFGFVSALTRWVAYLYECRGLYSIEDFRSGISVERGVFLSSPQDDIGARDTGAGMARHHADL